MSNLYSRRVIISFYIGNDITLTKKGYIHFLKHDWITFSYRRQYTRTGRSSISIHINEIVLLSIL